MTWFHGGGDGVDFVRSLESQSERRTPWPPLLVNLIGWVCERSVNLDAGERQYQVLIKGVRSLKCVNRREMSRYRWLSSVPPHYLCFLLSGLLDVSHIPSELE